jgi:hypothetical protein
MLGAQIIAAFKNNNNTIVAKTFNVKYYNDVISKKLVTIDTWDMRATLMTVLESGPRGR